MKYRRLTVEGKKDYSKVLASYYKSSGHLVVRYDPDKVRVQMEPGMIYLRSDTKLIVIDMYNKEAYEREAKGEADTGSE